MRLRTANVRRHHLAPRCLACGHEAHAAGPCCQACGTDLLERPPRSYAEMEGLVDAGEPEIPSDPFVRWRQAVLLERWLATAFAAAVVTACLLHVLGKAWGSMGMNWSEAR